MKHLVIYYLATSNYKMGFVHFKKNLKYMFPDMKKTVIICSDGLTEWNNVVEDGITYKVHYINHFHWPIIALFKMKFILDYSIHCDYVCYMNGNLQYNKDYNGDDLDLTKLNLSRHSTADESVLYDFEKFAPHNCIHSKSKAYINIPYTYVQAALFLGPADITYRMCEDVSNMTESDLKNNIIPYWHDESYLNKWRLDNLDKVHEPNKLISYGQFANNIPFAIIETIKKDRRLSKI